MRCLTSLILVLLCTHVASAQVFLSELEIDDFQQAISTGQLKVSSSNPVSTATDDPFDTGTDLTSRTTVSRDWELTWASGFLQSTVQIISDGGGLSWLADSNDFSNESVLDITYSFGSALDIREFTGFELILPQDFGDGQNDRELRVSILIEDNMARQAITTQTVNLQNTIFTAFASGVDLSNVTSIMLTLDTRVDTSLDFAVDKFKLVSFEGGSLVPEPADFGPLLLLAGFAAIAFRRFRRPS